MKKRMIIIMVLITALLIPSLLPAIETAPRISDRELVERLAKLEEGQKSLRSEMNSRFNDLRSEMNGRFNDLRSEMNGRFNILQWMLGLFITIALVILGFVLRMQWQMQKRQTSMETSLETYKDELTFIKGLIDKLLPPKGVL